MEWERPQQLANWLISLEIKGRKLASLLLILSSCGYGAAGGLGTKSKMSLFSGTEGADPGAVVFDGISSARHQGDTLVIIDTAGRSHVNKNLLAELEKSSELQKLILPSNLKYFSYRCFSRSECFYRLNLYFQWLTSVVSFSLNGIARLKGNCFPYW